MANLLINYIDRICVLSVNRPPVNAVDAQVAREMLQALNRLKSEATCDGVVICGKEVGFIAGADVKSLGTSITDEPSIADVVDLLESFPKPVTAAIQRRALGGGLEVAMACHFRIATARTVLGQPEVHLGLIPGAGGTQRLPRLVGIPKALEMITSGEPIQAEEALELGLVDEVASDSDILQRAVEMTQDAHRSGDPIPRTSSRALEVVSPDTFAVAREKANHTLKGYEAPILAIEAVESGCHSSFEQGLHFEQEQFETALGSLESRALRHLFFAERAAYKKGGMHQDAPAIRSVGIVGAGLMGTGIATWLAAASIPVILIDDNEETLQLASQNIARRLERIGNHAAQVASGAIAPSQPVTTTRKIETAAECDLLIEAVYESLSVKHQVLSMLSEVCRPDAIIATNTSYLDVEQLATFVHRPERFLGMHFFSPANIMRLVEVVELKTSSPGIVSAVASFVHRHGKVPVFAGTEPGFIGNQMFDVYLKEAGLLLLEGAKPEQVDIALTAFGFAMGPFAVQDMAGLEIGFRKRQNDETPGSEQDLTRIEDVLFQAGRHGRKNGKGFYQYEEGERIGVADPEVGGFVEVLARKLKIKQKEFTEETIVRRCVAALSREGCRLLETKTARDPADIDLVWAYGFGFPRTKGGPMFYADHIEDE